ncbi:hypothetical protein PIB30_070816 [Stylosanthes scabra]|uniref:Uncharacterized protein n=1 Tax=Stylosanthes scabra TaxID=79078 RepID=A0ABU6TN89_9FABA|nr:hypothetical protein [Stylosanthes scabra]
MAQSKNGSFQPIILPILPCGLTPHRLARTLRNISPQRVQSVSAFLITMATCRLAVRGSMLGLPWPSPPHSPETRPTYIYVATQNPTEIGLTQVNSDPPPTSSAPIVFIETMNTESPAMRGRFWHFMPTPGFTQQAGIGPTPTKLPTTEKLAPKGGASRGVGVSHVARILKRE